ncbi:hypothetical protein ACFW1A_35230 [Kitasatospora sp. NPDC058965]|uniref:hypothetical protein n=1 Tax=Kitasatospora sp. NPDC058965 TaxID=3346682 RepID=UPI0036855A2B
MIELVGGRGSGKTTLLDELHANYVDRVPLVRADLAAPDFGFDELAGLPGDEAAGASQLTNLLYLLSDRLQLKVPHARAPRFRRLSLGLVVVTAWSDTAAPKLPDELRQAMARFREAILADSADLKRRKELLKQWLDALAPVATTLVALPPGADALVRTAATTARDLLFAPRGDREALDWWGKRLPAARYPGDAVQKLYRFGQVFQQQDARREEIEKFLVAALLADIDDNYGRLRRWNDAARPVLLLDNIDGKPGDRFRARLNGAFALLGADRPDFTYPVIVATSRGDSASVPLLTDAPGAAGERWRRMGLPPVRQAEIREMLVIRRYPEHLPLLVERLGGGRAGTACALIEVFEELHGLDGSSEIDAFLDRLRPERDPELVTRLLAQLLPAAELRERLRLLSVALDRDAAVRLLNLRSQTDPVGRIEEAEAYLRDCHWELRNWTAGDGKAPFVTDSALRALLLAHLRASPPEGTDWDQLQRRARSGYGKPAQVPGPWEEEAKYLHHTLALGETAEVESALHRRFATDRPADWLAIVNIVSAAPHPPRMPDRPAPAPCPVCTAEDAAPTAGPVHLAISRLVAALWQQSSPLAVPDDNTIADIKAELETLCSNSSDERGALRQARNTWPGLLLQGVQAPDLPTGSENT